MKASQQLSLFGAGTGKPAAHDDAGDAADQEGAVAYVRGVNLDRSGITAYLHLIRSAQDPERSPRPEGGRLDRAPHRTLTRTAVDHWAARICERMADGVARTFNRIGVELLDQSSDMLLDSPVDQALWQLVDQGTLEHTMEAPILFRLWEKLHDAR